MLAALFTTVTGWFEGSIPLALGAAFVWGTLSVLLSPCHLSSIPLAIGYVNGKGRTATGRAFLLSLAFAAGILVTIALVGAATAAVGRMLGDLGMFRYLVAVVFIVVGLWLVGIVKLPGLEPGPDEKRRGGGAGGAFLLGLVFGLALGPCSFGFMMPLLAVAFRDAARAPAVAAGLVGAYVVGHTAVIVLAGTFANLVQKWLDWDERSKGTKVVRIACGILVILAGMGMIVGIR